jgi:hypothetical protein
MVLPTGGNPQHERERSFVRIARHGTSEYIYGVFDCPADVPVSALITSFEVKLSSADFDRIQNQSSVTKITGKYTVADGKERESVVYQLTLGSRNPSETIRHAERARP